MHKEGVPLGPIVSTIGSSTYKLAKELAGILSPLVGHMNSFVKDFTHFVKKIRESGVMASFDVVSLSPRSL